MNEVAKKRRIAGDEPMEPIRDRTNRNLSDKLRRDRFNSYISELGELIAPATPNIKRREKISVLKLAVNCLQLHHDLRPVRMKETWQAPFVTADNLGVALLESLGGFLFIVSRKGTLMFVSNVIEKNLGHIPDEIIGQPVCKIIHPDDHGIIRMQLSQIDETKDSLSDPPHVQKTECRNVSFYIRMKQVRDQSSPLPMYEMVHVVGQVTKSYKTKHKGSHFPLQPGISMIAVGRLQTELRIQDIISAPPEGEYITRHDMMGIINFTHPVASRHTGYMPEEVVGKSAYAFLHQQDVVAMEKLHKQLFSDGVVHLVGRTCSKFGETIYEKMYGYLCVNKCTKKPEYIISVHQIISAEEGKRLIGQRAIKQGDDKVSDDDNYDNDDDVNDDEDDSIGHAKKDSTDSEGKGNPDKDGDGTDDNTMEKDEANDEEIFQKMNDDCQVQEISCSDKPTTDKDTVKLKHAKRECDVCDSHLKHQVHSLDKPNTKETTLVNPITMETTVKTLDENDNDTKDKYGIISIDNQIPKMTSCESCLNNQNKITRFGGCAVQSTCLMSQYDGKTLPENLSILNDECCVMSLLKTNTIQECTKLHCGDPRLSDAVAWTTDDSDSPYVDICDCATEMNTTDSLNMEYCLSKSTKPSDIGPKMNDDEYTTDIEGTFHVTEVTGTEDVTQHFQKSGDSCVTANIMTHTVAELNENEFKLGNTALYDQSCNTNKVGENNKTYQKATIDKRKLDDADICGELVDGDTVCMKTKKLKCDKEDSTLPSTPDMIIGDQSSVVDNKVIDTSSHSSIQNIVTSEKSKISTCILKEPAMTNQMATPATMNDGISQDSSHKNSSNNNIQNTSAISKVHQSSLLSLMKDTENDIVLNLCNDVISTSVKPSTSRRSRCKPYSPTTKARILKSSMQYRPAVSTWKKIQNLTSQAAQRNAQMNQELQQKNLHLKIAIENQLREIKKTKEEITKHLVKNPSLEKLVDMQILDVEKQRQQLNAMEEKLSQMNGTTTKSPYCDSNYFDSECVAHLLKHTSPTNYVHRPPQSLEATTTVPGVMPDFSQNTSITVSYPQLTSYLLSPGNHNSFCHDVGMATQIASPPNVASSTQVRLTNAEVVTDHPVLNSKQAREHFHKKSLDFTKFSDQDRSSFLAELQEQAAQSPSFPIEPVNTSLVRSLVSQYDQPTPQQQMMPQHSESLCDTYNTDEQGFSEHILSMLKDTDIEGVIGTIGTCLDKDNHDIWFTDYDGQKVDI
ncbi:uncharacterized protein LOC100374620 [Saccoglossus kowalevskii]|uniref:Uncharacterized protein LOC100374620 n=1 Tax=Saccoglossus kowalevskii TaxID=10224 RepID=A0ABM0M5Y0_SACKO|nr:PREDICTED: uncharacterized protein LOC100374620 [Saccoglossus kowalevskii]